MCEVATAHGTGGSFPAVPVDGGTSGNAVAFGSAGLNQLVRVDYGPCSVTATANVFELQSVVWEAINSPLTPNNHPSGTVGRKMFPDKNDLTDTLEHRTVKVRATINPQTNDFTVYFKLFDVDDPSSGVAPVDTNDTVNVTGDDNRDDTVTAKGGVLDQGMAPTGTNGIAEVTLKVSRQPGNNFRVGADCHPDELDKLQVTNSTDAATYVPSGSGAPSGFHGKLAEMLTVWRDLHIERDSMESLTSYEKEVQMSNLGWVNKSKVGLPNNYWFEASAVLWDYPDEDEYEGGRLFFILTGVGGQKTRLPANPSDYFTVLKSKAFGVGKGKAQIAIADSSGNPLSGPDAQLIRNANVAQFRIYDDDDFSIFDSFPRLADGGQIMENALADCYVHPFYADSQAEGNLRVTRPFIRKLTTSDLYFSLDDTKDLTSEPDFWVTLVVTCFEPNQRLGQWLPLYNANADLDPDGKRDFIVPIVPPPDSDLSHNLGPLYGASQLFTWNLSAIFLEMLREDNVLIGPPFALDEQHDTTHEVGHTIIWTGAFGNGHPPGKDHIMTEDAGDVQKNSKFRPQDVDTIRKANTW